MRRIKTEIAIIGSGAAAMLAANRLIGHGVGVILINPAHEFSVSDLRPVGGLSLWNAAYRGGEDASLAELYEILVDRLREVFPATIEQSGLRKGQHLSILSSTPVHRAVTDEFEREFFRLERKKWSSGQIRLVNPEYAIARAKRLGVELPRAAQVEGGMLREYGLWWDAPRIGMYLSQFIHNKLLEKNGYFVDAEIKSRYGRKLVLMTSEGEELSVECENAQYIFLTGELLPYVKTIVAACDEPWIQGVRRRRREQHFAWFERPMALQPLFSTASHPESQDEEFWIELGYTRYRWSRAGGLAVWQSGKGPDGLEKVIDEGLRLHSLPNPDTRFVRAERSFRLDWDWKNPQWRETSHKTYWATSFEGDIWGILELLWNLPHL